MRFFLDAWDWRGVTGRRAFALSFGFWLALALGINALPSLGAAQAGLVLLCGGMTLLVAGHARRRLRHIGWSGWWIWLLVVPLVSVVFALVLVLRRGRGAAQPGAYSRIGKGLAIMLALFVASRAVWHPYTFDTGSMTPTLRAGDTIVALRRFGAVARGDLVVFRHPTKNVDFIKRVMGVSGDTVQMVDGVPVINGTALAQTLDGQFTEPYRRTATGGLPRCSNAPVPMDAPCHKDQFIETSPDGVSYKVLSIGAFPMDQTAIFTVPEGHVFVMGDNRDNSTDSRVPIAAGGPGMVPVSQVISRSLWVVFNRAGAR